MAFFSVPEEPAASPVVLTPLSTERIEAALKSREWRYFVDSDGNIGGNWDHHQFYFYRYGENDQILQVRGLFNRRIPVSMRADVLLAIDEWHQQKIFPKAYTRTVDDEDTVGVFGEYAADFRGGVTDDQLVNFISLAISTACDFFEFMDTKFPQTVRKADD